MNDKIPIQGSTMVDEQPEENNSDSASDTQIMTSFGLVTLGALVILQFILVVAVIEWAAASQWTNIALVTPALLLTPPLTRWVYDNTEL